MNNLAKVEEEQHKKQTYLMQSNKSTRKSDGEFSLYTRLLLETTMMKKSLTETVLYHLPTWKPSMRKYFQNAAGFLGINIVGFSQENFALYKLPKVRQLTDCLYNVAFGDLNFTDLGKTCLPEM
jgi:hypothetical protein